MGQDTVRRWSLCQTDRCCPEVVVDPVKGEVRIGEEGNLVTLDKRHWNDLVAKIRSGALTPL